MSEETASVSTDLCEERPAKKNRLGVCTVCSQNESKYTCPACLIPFCCVECSKKHKEDTKCTGKRDITAFVELGKFDNSTLRSGRIILYFNTLDYHFLEEAKLKTDRLERTRKAENIDDHPFQFHPNHVKFVQRRIHERSIHMQLMPQGMSRRERNTTHYRSKEERVYWRVEFLFDQVLTEVAEDKQPYKIEEPYVKEETSLIQLLMQYLDSNAVAVTGNAQGESLTVTNALIRNKLEKYVTTLTQYRETSGDVQGTPFALFMLAERKPTGAPNTPLYYRLDSSKPLKESLVDKIVVEFPIVHVVLPEHVDQYPIITEEQIQATLKELKDRIQERKDKKKAFQDRQEQYEQKMLEKQQAQQSAPHQQESHEHGNRGRSGHNFRGNYRGRGRGGYHHNQ
jgi:hypothetical protein